MQVIYCVFLMVSFKIVDFQDLVTCTNFSHKSNLQNICSLVHLSVSRHFLVVLSQLLLHRCLSLSQFRMQPLNLIIVIIRNKSTAYYFQLTYLITTCSSNISHWKLYSDRASGCSLYVIAKSWNREEFKHWLTKVALF